MMALRWEQTSEYLKADVKAVQMVAQTASQTAASMAATKADLLAEKKETLTAHCLVAYWAARKELTMVALMAS